MFPVDQGASSVWDRVAYAANLLISLVVEFKNYGRSRVGKSDVDQLADYLTDATGRVGILCYRGIMSPAAAKRANSRWCHDRRIVLFLGPADVEEMCDIAERGDDPAIAIRDKLEAFLLGVE